MLLLNQRGSLMGDIDFLYQCNVCRNNTERGYHCTVCDDFDLCMSCKDQGGHIHHMEILGFDLDDGSSPANAKQQNPQEARKLSIQRCIQSLVHACQCRDANCRLPNCGKMKRVVTHTKVCKTKTNGGCPICKQLIALCCYHAKHCQETKCLVPFCSNIKHKLKQQRLQEELQQTQLLGSKMAAMNGQMQQQVQQQHPDQPGLGMGGGGQMSRLTNVIGGGGPGGVPQVGPQNTNVNMQAKPLQQLLQTLRSPSTPEQQSQILQILKSNPPLMAAFIKQRQQQSDQHGGAIKPMDPSQQQQVQQQVQQQNPGQLGLGKAANRRRRKVMARCKNRAMVNKMKEKIGKLMMMKIREELRSDINEMKEWMVKEIEEAKGEIKREIDEMKQKIREVNEESMRAIEKEREKSRDIQVEEK